MNSFVDRSPWLPQSRVYFDTCPVYIYLNVDNFKSIESVLRIQLVLEGISKTADLGNCDRAAGEIGSNIGSEIFAPIGLWHQGE